MTSQGISVTSESRSELSRLYHSASILLKGQSFLRPLRKCIYGCQEAMGAYENMVIRTSPIPGKYLSTKNYCYEGELPVFVTGKTFVKHIIKANIYRELPQKTLFLEFTSTDFKGSELLTWRMPLLQCVVTHRTYMGGDFWGWCPCLHGHQEGPQEH